MAHLAGLMLASIADYANTSVLLPVVFAHSFAQQQLSPTNLQSPTLTCEFGRMQ